MGEPSDTVGYAVVGLGWISQAAVLPAFANAARNSRLAALVSGDATKRRVLAGRYGLPGDAAVSYDEYEACLERPDVDAVYIALPNHLHREYAVRAAERGVHVLCEKPMAVSAAECRDMIAACEAAGVRLMVAYRLHFDVGSLHAVDAVRRGRIGPTRVFSSVLCQQVGGDDVRMIPADRGGGPLHDIGIYCINAARYLFRAEPESVWATRATRPLDRFADSDEMVAGVLRFPGERLATFTCSFGAHAAAHIELVGDAGRLHLDNAYHFRGERTFELRSGGGDHEHVRFPETDQFGALLLHFSDCILHALEPGPDGEEGLVDVRIIEALLESMSTGRAVELELRRERRPEPEHVIECPPVEAPEMVQADEPSR